MRIGELAERTGLSRRSLRYYEQHKLIASRRTSNGWRTYDEAVVLRVRNIARLLHKGLTVREVQRLEPCLEQHDWFACDDPRRALDTYLDRLAVLDERLVLLQRQRDSLAGLVHTLRTTSPTGPAGASESRADRPDQ